MPTRISTLAAACLLITVFLSLGLVTEAKAQTYEVFYSFAGGADGSTPQGTLLVDSKGNLYGTTLSGGENGWGTFYQLSPTATKKTLVSFHGTPDGASPTAGVIGNAAGVYGTTQFGGPANAGTVYTVGPDGTESILYSFQGGADGADAFGGLVRDSAGNLYGTTDVGGNFANTYCGQNGCGTVYKIDAEGNHTILHTFSGPDGGLPLQGLVLDSAGSLYGTTGVGGTGSCDLGCGVIYKIDTANNYTILHQFLGTTSDGAGPASSLIMDKAGNLYGTTASGGAFQWGIIYELTTSGTFTILHSFNGKEGGAYPEMGLLPDAEGNLYGTTELGGLRSCNYFLNGCGIVYVLTKKGAFKVLHTFTGTPDGANPSWGSLSKDSSGNIYGPAMNGGASGDGMIFKITP